MVSFIVTSGLVDNKLIHILLEMTPLNVSQLLWANSLEIFNVAILILYFFLFSFLILPKIYVEKLEQLTSHLKYKHINQLIFNLFLVFMGEKSITYI